MNAAERQQKIYEYILSRGSVKVGSLCRLLDISQPTARKDLEAMEQKGLIVREFGKASLKNDLRQNSVAENQSQAPYEQLRSQQAVGQASGKLDTTAEKTAIGHYAASLIEDGETLILDCGATATEMAKGLLAKNRLRVITSGVNIAMILGQKSDNHIILSGGTFLPETLSLVGESAVRFFEGIHVPKLFLAANGLHPATGLTYADFIDIGIKKAMLNAAAKVYLIISSNKIGHRGFTSIDALPAIDVIITDNRLSDENRRWLYDLNDNIIEVPV